MLGLFPLKTASSLRLVSGDGLAGPGALGAMLGSGTPVSQDHKRENIVNLGLHLRKK